MKKMDFTKPLKSVNLGFYRRCHKQYLLHLNFYGVDSIKMLQNK